MTNAAQHTPSGKVVRVTTSAAPAPLPDTGNRVQIRVTDEGSGIPAEDLPHIFERFLDPIRPALHRARASV